MKLAAHEAQHIEQFRTGAICSEIRCEQVAIERLEQWRTVLRQCAGRLRAARPARLRQRPSGPLELRKAGRSASPRPFCQLCPRGAQISDWLGNEDSLDLEERVRRGADDAVGTAVRDLDLADLDDGTLAVLDRARNRCVSRRVRGARRTDGGAGRRCARGCDRVRNVNDRSRVRSTARGNRVEVVRDPDRGIALQCRQCSRRRPRHSLHRRRSCRPCTARP